MFFYIALSFFVCRCDSRVFVMMFLEHWKSPRNSLFTLFKESDIPNLRIKFANDLLLSPKNYGRKDLVSSYQFTVSFFCRFAVCFYKLLY